MGAALRSCTLTAGKLWETWWAGTGRAMTAEGCQCIRCRVHLHHPRESIPVCESTLLQHLLGEGTLHIHDQLQHLIVSLAWEQDLASE